MWVLIKKMYIFSTVFPLTKNVNFLNSVSINKSPARVPRVYAWEGSIDEKGYRWKKVLS
jgi:hypothetical protein